MDSAVAEVRKVNNRRYTPGPGCQTVYQTSGDCVDDSYGTLHIVHSYTVEAYGTSFTPSPAEIPRIGQEIWVGVRQTAKLILQELDE